MKSKPKLIRWIKRHRRRRRHLHCCCCRSSVSTKIHSRANQNARASEMKTKRSRYQLRWAYVNGIEWETQYPWITSSSSSSQTKRNERTIIKKNVSRWKKKEQFTCTARVFNQILSISKLLLHHFPRIETIFARSLTLQFVVHVWSCDNIQAVLQREIWTACGNV